MPGRCLFLEQKMAKQQQETKITYEDAAELVSKKEGVSVNVRTVRRWARKGCKRGLKEAVFLEFTRVGPNQYTTAEAVDRFLQRLNAVDA
jgi:hypothetical protein